VVAEEGDRDVAAVGVQSRGRSRDVCGHAG
jgi:hypothetical protein